MMAATCGQPMRRYETASGRPPEDPACGRPAGHQGPHRSQAAVARYRRADLERWQDRGHGLRQARRRAA